MLFMQGIFVAALAAAAVGAAIVAAVAGTGGDPGDVIWAVAGAFSLWP